MVSPAGANFTRVTTAPGSAPADVAQDFVGGVPAAGAPDAAAGVGAGAAHVEALDGGAVVGEAGGRAEGEELVGRHGAVVDVAARQAEDRLEILGCVDVAGDDRLRQVRGVTRDLGDHAVGDGLLQALPGPAGQVERAVLHEAGHDVLPGRRAGRVEHRVDARLDRRALPEPTPLPVV